MRHYFQKFKQTALCSGERHLSLSSKAVHYTHILEKIIQTKGEPVPCLKDMQKSERPMENHLATGGMCWGGRSSPTWRFGGEKCTPLELERWLQSCISVFWALTSVLGAKKLQSEKWGTGLGSVALCGIHSWTFEKVALPLLSPCNRLWTRWLCRRLCFSASELWGSLSKTSDFPLWLGHKKREKVVLWGTSRGSSGAQKGRGWQKPRRATFLCRCN